MSDYINKVIYGNRTLMDISGDTVAETDVLSPKTFHLATGEQKTGSITTKAANTYYPSTDAQTIAAGQYLGGVQTIAAVTTTNLSAANIASGVTVSVGDAAHQSGVATVTGTYTDTDAAPTAGEIITGKTAYANGNEINGTMPNNGTVTTAITTKAQSVTIAQGYHSGAGTVAIDSTEQDKIIAGNIKSGVEILGVTGTYSGEGGTGQAKTVTPLASWSAAQVVTPDTGYDFLTQVTVNTIPYLREVNGSTGGDIVTIGVA